MTNKKTRFTFRIPTELFDKLKDDACKQGVSTNSLMLQILWQHIEQKERCVK